MAEIDSTPTLSRAGTNGILFDVASGRFDGLLQQRLWAVNKILASSALVRESIPGMNNLLVLFDSKGTEPQEIEDLLQTLWSTALPDPQIGRDLDVPVVYGGEFGEDLPGLAERTGLSVGRVVQLHSEAIYCVSSIGAMPGFTYLSGLPPELDWARRSVPRMGVQKGAIIIGGSQAGIMPCTSPSGWHVIGRTELDLFNPVNTPPNRFQLGDRIRFRVAGVQS